MYKFLFNSKNQNYLRSLEHMYEFSLKIELQFFFFKTEHFSDHKYFSPFGQDISWYFEFKKRNDE